MRLLLLDTRNDRHYTGENTSDLILNTGRVTIDLNSRRAVIDGKPDTVSYSSEYTSDELLVEACRRALQVLTRDYGFVLYSRHD